MRRRGWVIVVTALVAAFGAYFVAKRSVAVYQAHAEVLLRGSISPNANQTSPVSFDVDTEIRVLRGSVVQQDARKALPNAVPIAGASMSSSSSFTISTNSTNPKLAADSANAYANAYIKELQSQTVSSILAASDQVQTKINDLQRQIVALGPQSTSSSTSTQSAADVQRLALENQQANYRVQLNDLQLQVSNLSAGAVLLSPAAPSTTPVSPRPVRTAAEAGAGGLVVGLGLAFLLEFLDDTVRATEALERLGGGLPVLGIIPTMTSWRERNRPHLVVRLAPSSPAAEAFRSLRTSVRFLSLDRPISVIHVTSPSSRDGKTTTVANLATALAQAGEKVAVVDLDLRRPRIHDFFGMSNDIGFTSVALGDASLSEALRPAPGVAGLYVLTAGPPPSNPSELLSSTRATEVINMLRAKGWLLIVDSPPLVPVADATLVSTMADATLLVTSAGLTKKHEVKRSLEVLSQVKAPLVGTVLNRAITKRHYYYAYQGAPAPKVWSSATPTPGQTNGGSPGSVADRELADTSVTSSSFRVAKAPTPPRRPSSR